VLRRPPRILTSCVTEFFSGPDFGRLVERKWRSDNKAGSLYIYGYHRTAVGKRTSRTLEALRAAALVAITVPSHFRDFAGARGSRALMRVASVSIWVL